MKNEFLDTLNACLAKEQKRTDIIKEYIDYFHEQICSELTVFWEKYYNMMGNFYYLKIIQWINAYAEVMKQFFSDERIPNGGKTLLAAYFARTLKSSEEIIDGIIIFEKKNPPQKDESGILYSSSPFDLFKIINEIFELSYKICSFKEMGLKLATFSKKVITLYQTKLQDLMEEEDLEVNKFICICNNVISFSTLTKELGERLQTQCQLKPEECDKSYDCSTLIKNFTSIGITSKDIIFNCMFNELNKSFNKVQFLSINLEKVLSLVDIHKSSLKLLHDSFSRKIWKNFLEKIVIFYFQTMIISCNKAGKDDLENFITKLNKDQDYLNEQFEGIIFTNTLKNELIPFEEMISFLEETSIFKLQASCKNIRGAFGPAFNEKAVKAILNARSDLDNNEKNDIAEGCKNTLDIYNKENLDKEKQEGDGKNFDLFGEGINLEDSEEKPENEEKTKETDTDQNRRKSLKLDNSETVESNSSPLKEESKTKDEIAEKFSGEGYLYKKPPKKFKIKWEKRYVRIKNGVLYWYVNERSRECQNKIMIADIEDVFPHKNLEKKTKFKISISKPKKKIYKFMAENQKDRLMWIRALKEEMKKCHQTVEDDSIAIQVASGENKKPIFIDFDELRRKQNSANDRKEKELKEESQKKNKIQNIKAKLLVQKMQNNMNTMKLQEEKKGKKLDMNNPKIMKKPKEESNINEEQKNVSCCQKFLECIGLSERQDKERLIGSD